jgi:hypothetical protein
MRRFAGTAGCGSLRGCAEGPPFGCPVRGEEASLPPPLCGVLATGPNAPTARSGQSSMSFVRWDLLSLSRSPTGEPAAPPSEHGPAHGHVAGGGRRVTYATHDVTASTNLSTVTARSHDAAESTGANLRTSSGTMTVETAR